MPSACFPRYRMTRRGIDRGAPIPPNLPQASRRARIQRPAQIMQIDALVLELRGERRSFLG